MKNCYRASRCVIFINRPLIVTAATGGNAIKLARGTLNHLAVSPHSVISDAPVRKIVKNRVGRARGCWQTGKRDLIKYSVPGRASGRCDSIISTVRAQNGCIIIWIGAISIVEIVNDDLSHGYRSLSYER